MEHHGTYLVRTPVHNRDVRLRGDGLSSARKKGIRMGLRTLHNLEIMAVNVYRFQIGSAPNEHNRQLVAAMLNELTHAEDFLVKLAEFRMRPSLFRWTTWMAGMAIGLVSRRLGPKCVLRTGIWVETKAVRHYGELLNGIEWDDGTRAVIEKDRHDEVEHIRTWKGLLREG